MYERQTITFNSVDLYNEEIKLKYLNRMSKNEDSIKTIRALLAKATPFEIMFKRDLFSFNMEEIANVISHSDPIDNRMAERTFMVYSAYILWALRQGYYLTNIHPMDGFPKSWAHEFVGKKKLYVNDEELAMVEDSLENYQDKVALRLIFEGVLGKDHSEILNLKRKNINFNTGVITVRDIKRGAREVKLSERALTFVSGALDEGLYRKWELKGGSMFADYEPLVESDYVIRGLSRKPDLPNNRPQGYQVIYNRIKKIREKYEFDYMTSKRLQKSGMLAMAAELIKERGKFGIKERKEVGKRYNMPKIVNGDYYEYNVITFGFINPKNLKEIHNINVDENLTIIE